MEVTAGTFYGVYFPTFTPGFVNIHNRYFVRKPPQSYYTMDLESRIFAVWNSRRVGFHGRGNYRDVIICSLIALNSEITRGVQDRFRMPIILDSTVAKRLDLMGNVNVTNTANLKLGLYL